MSMWSKYVSLYIGFSLIAILNFYFNQLIGYDNSLTEYEERLLFVTIFGQYFDLIYAFNMIIAVLISSDPRIKDKLSAGALTGFLGQIMFQMMMSSLYVIILSDNSAIELWAGDDGSFSIIEFLKLPIFSSIFVAGFIFVFLSINPYIFQYKYTKRRIRDVNQRLLKMILILNEQIIQSNNTNLNELEDTLSNLISKSESMSSEIDPLSSYFETLEQSEDEQDIPLSEYFKKLHKE